MKKALLLKSMLLLCALIVGMSSAWGQTTVQTTSFSSTRGNVGNDTKVNFTSYKGGGTTDPALSNNCIRLYQRTNGGLGGYIVIGVPENYVITDISITPNAVTKAGYMLTNTDPGSTTPSANSFVETDHACSQNTEYAVNNISSRYVVFGNFGDSNSNSTRRLDIKAISVTYQSTGGGNTPTISVDPTSLSGFTYVENSGSSTAKTIFVSGSNLTGDIGLSLGESSNYEMSKTQGSGYGNSLTLTQTDGAVEETPIYVRLKSGLEKGTYNGTLTLSSTGATDVVIDLSGIVTGQTYAIEQYTSPATAHGTITFSPVSPVETGAEVTLTATPADHYTFTADSWVFYKESGNDIVVDNSITVTNGKITMPAYNLYVDAIFAPIPVSSVSLNNTSALLKIGKELTLTATVLPENAADKSITWESNDENVATVDENGKVTAVALGTAAITVKSVAEPTKSATCTITVTDGSIDLSTTGEITFGNWSTSILGTSYGARECALTGSDGNTYYWNEVDGYYNNSGWQIKATTGKVTSPIIKSNYGFTISVTKKTNNVIISDGTNSGKNSLTTTKTSTPITIVGDGAYAVFTSIKITPQKAPVATEVVITDPGTLAKDATGTFAYTATAEVPYTASWASATPSVITISDAATGAYTAAGRGTSKITLTLTPDDATNYRTVTAERTVTVTAPVVITANDVEMTYGDAAKAIGATTSTGYAGTLSYHSGNDNIATVDDASGKVTAVAAGTTTITISAPADADNLYTAGEDVEITVTVNAPEGSNVNSAISEKNIYQNSLLASSLPTGWAGDGTVWGIQSSYGIVTTSGKTNGTYDMKSPDINLSGYEGVTVRFEHTGNGQSSSSSSFSSPSSACKVYIQEGDAEPVMLSINYFTGTDWDYVSSGIVDLSDYEGKTVHFIFRYTPTSGNNGKWEVKNFYVKGTPVITENATVAASGYGSYCYEYPIDLDKLDENVKAYIVTNASEGNVTFKQIAGTIKGGVPFILYGTAGVHTLTLAASSNNVPENNMLKGTLSPKYITTVEGDYTNFGLSGGKFVKINNGTLPANKAYLPILTSVVEGSTGAPTFDIIFDEGTTGVENVNRVTINDNKYYTLDGRRVENPTKGLYIVNGKKVMIK